MYNGSLTKIKDHSLMLFDKKALPNATSQESKVLDSAIGGHLHTRVYIAMDIPALVVAADNSLDIKIQQSDDNTNWEETCRVHLEPGSYDKNRRAIGLVELKQFLRLQVTTTEDHSAKRITAWMVPAEA